MLAFASHRSPSPCRSTPPVDARLPGMESPTASLETSRPLIESPAVLYRLLRERIRLRHYSVRTERAYVHWARRFIAFHGRKHPRTLGAAQVTAFLAALATEGNVSAA